MSKRPSLPVENEATLPAIFGVRPAISSHSVTSTRDPYGKRVTADTVNITPLKSIDRKGVV